MWIVVALMLSGVAGSPRSAESLAPPVARAFQASEIIADIQVHGNLVTTDEELKRLAGVDVGTPFEPSLIEAVAERLRAAKRFERVDVLKRFASIADPSQIVIVIIVDEGRVRIARTGDPEHPFRAVRNRWPRLMYQPILRRDDRYGSTYGVRVAIPETFGSNSRLIFPFAWGGEKQAGVEYDKTNDAGLLNRVRAGGSWLRRTHPVFQEDEDREQLSLRGEHWFRPQWLTMAKLIFS